MTTHILTIDRRMFRMIVRERPDAVECLLTELTVIDVSVALTPAQRDAHYDHVFEWFHAIIHDLRMKTTKTISVFDRQHVMTT